MVYMISNSMERSGYTVTVSTLATDVYGLQLAEPYSFTFTTYPVSAEYMEASEVSIYPNPATDLMEIRGMDVAKVKIYSLTGQLVKEVHHSAVINVSDMDPGTYAMTVSDTEDRRVRKMIVIE